jgi:hypothetical protein
VEQNSTNTSTKLTVSDFWQRSQKHTWRKDSLFNILRSWKNWISTCTQPKPDLYFPTYTKTNSMWIQYFHVRLEIWDCYKINMKNTWKIRIRNFSSPSTSALQSSSRVLLRVRVRKRESA